TNAQRSQAGDYAVLVSNGIDNLRSSAASLSLGVVIAWGDYGSGQTNVPPGLTNIIGIAAGDYGSLALKGDGTIVGWGGVVGPFPALSNVVAIAAGSSFNFVLKTDGTLEGWGGYTPPTGLSNVAAIAAGKYHGLALKNDGTVVAWGDN